MTELFLKTINMSITASYLVLVVLVARLLLKKAPKWINILLWGMVAVRLLIPFSFESTLSMVPSTETVRPEIMTDSSPSIDSGITIVDTTVNTIIGQLPRPLPVEEATPLQIWIPMLSYLWIAGFAVLLAYTAFTYLRLRFRVREAVRYQENVYLSENATSPFVLGVLKPRIYLPYNMEKADMEHVIAHEKAHIRRKDHWWKPAGFLLLSVHWFNPLMWIAYVLLCRDIELACDEKVIRDLQESQRVEYSQVLLRCSIRHKTIAACPLAFGEDNVKNRIKKVLNYKKPAFWLIVIALISCVAVCIFFLTDPKDSKDFEEQRGIQGVSVTQEAGRSITLDVAYNELNGYSVVKLNADAKEYTKDGEIPYSGELGQYRMMITFPGVQPTNALTDQFPEGQVCLLQRATTAFGASFRVKRVQSEQHGVILYIGSYIPFSVEERESTEAASRQGSVELQMQCDPTQGALPFIQVGMKENDVWYNAVQQAEKNLPLRPCDYVFYPEDDRDVAHLLEFQQSENPRFDVCVGLPLSSDRFKIDNWGLDLTPYLTDRNGIAKKMWDQLPADTPLSILDQLRDATTGEIYIFPNFAVENGTVVLQSSGALIAKNSLYPDIAFGLLLELFYGESNPG